MTLDDIVAWLNTEYPERDWNQDCQRLVWNVVWCVTGVDESELNPPYPTATAARLASTIESLDASAAPVGAIHYFKNPAAGHVGVSLGGEVVLMTGTESALGTGARMCGTNYGVTTVSAYSKAMKNPYLGWARQNGRFPSLIGKISGGSPAGGKKVSLKSTYDAASQEPGGREIMAGEYVYLSELTYPKTSSYHPVTKGAGLCSVAATVRVEGEPGDEVEVVLVSIELATGKQSNHYSVTVPIGKNGDVCSTSTFNWSMAAGWEGAIRVTARRKNKATVVLKRLDCQTFMFA